MACEVDVTPRPHRIVFVTPDLSVGGTEAMLVRLVTATPVVAEEVTVVSLLPAEAYMERLRAAGVAVVELDFNTPSGIAVGLFRLARLIAHTRPEIVQGWGYHGNLAALIALTLSGQRQSTRLIWSIRCSHMDLRYYGARLRLAVKACTWLSRLPDLVTANSVAGLKSHLRVGFRPRRAEIVVNGIDIDAFKPDRAVRIALRTKLGIADDTVVLAHVARVDPMKDHAGFLAVMAQLPQLTALLIGAGTETLATPRNVIRLGLRDDVARLLAAADIVVSTSCFGEGFSNVIAEGMACGLPAIATDVGDARQIVGDSGLIVPADDRLALAAAIRTLATESPAVRAERGARARDRIVENFAMPRTLESYHQLYRSVLAGDATRSASLGGHPISEPATAPALPKFNLRRQIAAPRCLASVQG
jgi:glycosyltransferase involved in cell wall biosynthesis